MFRLTRYMQSLTDAPVNAKRPKVIPVNTGPVVIWNLIRRCNLPVNIVTPPRQIRIFPASWIMGKSVM